MSPSIHSAHLHFISPTLPDHIENAIQILYRFMDHTPLQSHPSIYLSSSPITAAISLTHQPAHCQIGLDRGNVATHGAPGVIDEIGADERASNVVGEEEVNGIGDGGHGAVLRPVGQEEVQRIGSALQAFVGSHVADQIAEEIGRHRDRDRNGQRGGRLAVHDQHRMNSDVAIVDTENCLVINSALPTSAVRHSIV